MIAVDTSALVAVVLGESDAERYLERLRNGPARLSSVSLVEATIVLEARQGADAVRDLEFLVDATADLVVAACEQARVAIAAWRRFGKGRHPAGRDFCDCFLYAVAHRSWRPVLFKRNDFSQT